MVVGKDYISALAANKNSYVIQMLALVEPSPVVVYAKKFYQRQNLLI